MLVFDTNVLVDAFKSDSEFHEPCKRILDEARQGSLPCYLTWSICYEFLRVVTHGRLLESSSTTGESWAFIRDLLELSNFSVLLPTDRHAAMLSQTISELPNVRGNRIHDLHIAVIMRENRITRICTRDSDFRRFPFVEVIDPLENSL